MLSTFYTSASNTLEIEIWRKPLKPNGDAPKVINSDIPALYGRELSHTISNAVIGPRITADVKNSPSYLSRNETGKTMYTQTDVDVKSSDYICYTDSRGEKQVYEIEGEADNEFISPYSGLHGGREIFIRRVTRKR